MLTINQIMTKLAQSFGMTVKESSMENRNIITTSGDVTVYMGYVDLNGRPNDIANHKIKAEVSGADKIIIWYLAPITREVRSIVKGTDIELWDKDRVIKEIGRAVLNLVRHKETVESIKVNTGFEDIFVHDNETLPNKDMKEIVEGSIAKDRHLGNYIVAKIDKKQIKSIVDNQFEGYEFKLQYIPYFVFDYRLKIIERKSRSDMTVKGVYGVNGIDSTLMEWDEGLMKTDSALEGSDIHDPEITEDNARAIVIKEAINRNGKTEETQIVKENTIIYEVHNWIVDSSTVEAIFKGIYYYPMWGVAGKSGIMMIDATNGNVIKKDLFEKN